MSNHKRQPTCQFVITYTLTQRARSQSRQTQRATMPTPAIALRIMVNRSDGWEHQPWLWAPAWWRDFAAAIVTTTCCCWLAKQHNDGHHASNHDERCIAHNHGIPAALLPNIPRSTVYTTRESGPWRGELQQQHHNGSSSGIAYHEVRGRTMDDERPSYTPDASKQKHRADISARHQLSWTDITYVLKYCEYFQMCIPLKTMTITAANSTYCISNLLALQI